MSQSKSHPSKSHRTKSRPSSSSLKSFIASRKAQLSSEPTIKTDVQVFANEQTRQRRVHHPPLTDAKSYITLICDAQHPHHMRVPTSILFVSDYARFIMSQDFLESSSRVIDFPSIRGEIMELVMRFCFQYYLESWSLMRPLQTSAPLDDTAPLLSHQHSFDELDHVHTTPIKFAESGMISIQFPIPPHQCFETLCAAHYMRIKPLFLMTAKMVAHHIDIVDTSAITSLHTDIIHEVIKHMTPLQLYRLEKRVGEIGIDTTPFWISHLSALHIEMGHRGTPITGVGMDKSTSDVVTRIVPPSHATTTTLMINSISSFSQIDDDIEYKETVHVSDNVKGLDDTKGLDDDDIKGLDDDDVKGLDDDESTTKHKSQPVKHTTAARNDMTSAIASLPVSTLRRSYINHYVQHHVHGLRPSTYPDFLTLLTELGHDLTSHELCTRLYTSHDYDNVISIQDYLSHMSCLERLDVIGMNLSLEHKRYIEEEEKKEHTPPGKKKKWVDITQVKEKQPKVEVSYTPYEGSPLQAILNYVQENSHLRHLTLPECQLSSYDITYVCVALEVASREEKGVETLNLSGNHITMSGLCDLLRNRTNIRHLDLSHNYCFGTLIPSHLTPSPHSTLLSLDLRGNNLGGRAHRNTWVSHGVNRYFRSEHESMERERGRVDPTHNLSSSISLFTLLPISLQSLCLATNDLNQWDIDVLFIHMERLINLTNLDLSQNGMSNTDLTSILPFFKDHIDHPLLTLNLCHNRIKLQTEWAAQLISICAYQNRKLLLTNAPPAVANAH